MPYATGVCLCGQSPDGVGQFVRVVGFVGECAVVSSADLRDSGDLVGHLDGLGLNLVHPRIEILDEGAAGVLRAVEESIDEVALATLPLVVGVVALRPCGALVQQEGRDRVVIRADCVGDYGDCVGQPKQANDGDAWDLPSKACV